MDDEKSDLPDLFLLIPLSLRTSEREKSPKGEVAPFQKYE